MVFLFCQAEDSRFFQVTSSLPPTALLHFSLGLLCPKREDSRHWPWEEKREEKIQGRLTSEHQYKNAGPGLSFPIHLTGAGPDTFQL